ncbi:MAG: hypothetical protein LIO46_06745 [Clostridiales bacterium]|nr:hypothetical protein [Clostridiales bacterium]
MLALFQVIDNPMQDIPLLSVLLSPIYGFTPDDLAQMRIDDRDASLYQCLVHAAQAGGGKAAAFLESLQRLRTYCVTLEPAQAVQKIYDETAYPAIAAGMGSARRRQANLNLLADYAAGHSGSFSSFVRFLCRLRESGRGLRGTAAGAAGGAVQLMSIHRSKGLEFPVCILAGNSRKYDQSSLRDDLLLHPELGAGLKVIEEEQGYRYKTIPYQALQLAIRNAELSESLRVLYVAMTRARENLIFILSEDHPRQAVRNAARKLDGSRIDPYVVGRAARDADWLLCCALLHEDGGVLRELADCEIAPLKGQGRLSVRFIGDAFTRAQA